MVSRDKWIETVRSYIGVPFRHQGRNRNGVDCFGLLVSAARDLGIDDPRLDMIVGYRATPSADLIRTEIPNFCTERPYNRLQPLRNQAVPGDLLVIEIQGRDTARHMGIYTGVGKYNFDYMIHSPAMGSKRVEEVQIVPSKWAAKINSVWTIDQVEG